MVTYNTDAIRQPW